MTKRIISLSGPVNRERGETREHPVEFLGCPAPVEGAPRTGIVPRQPGSRQRRKQFQKCAQEGNEEQKTLRVGGSPPTLTTGSDLPLGPTDELDEIVADAMTHREQQPWRLSTSE